MSNRDGCPPLGRSCHFRRCSALMPRVGLSLIRCIGTPFLDMGTKPCRGAGGPARGTTTLPLILPHYRRQCWPSERSCPTVPQSALAALPGVVHTAVACPEPKKRPETRQKEAAMGRILSAVHLAHVSSKRLVRRSLPHWHAMTASLVEGRVATRTRRGLRSHCARACRVRGSDAARGSLPSLEWWSVFPLSESLPTGGCAG